MEQFTFDTLCEDDQLLMLKYMPIKERVRFERINTRWAGLLESLWLGEKQVQFSWDLGREAKCHAAYQIDYLDARSDIIVPAEMLKVISRCKNLKALFVNSTGFEQVESATQLAIVLNDNCMELEHLNLRYSTNMVFFEQFNPSNKFTCIFPSSYDRLEKLYNKKTPAQRLPLKLIDYDEGQVNPKTWDLVNKVSVEHLAAGVWDPAYNDLINLKSLVIYDYAKTDVIGDFHQLEHISLAFITKTSLRVILESNRNLVSLHLTDGAEDLMETVFRFGLNLTELNLDFYQRALVKDYEFWEKLAKLTKLRSLAIYIAYDAVDPKLNANGLYLVLQECKKLKYFYFSGPSSPEYIMNAVEKAGIRKVVDEKSFRKAFVVNFHPEEDSAYITVSLR